MGSGPRRGTGGSWVRGIAAVVVGTAACLALNSLLLHALLGAMELPEGFDPARLATFELLEARHLVAPLVAHALPSAVGGLLAAVIAARQRLAIALVVGGLHLLGGIVAALLIPAPVWFVAVDLGLAYLPMAWLGGQLGRRLARRSGATSAE